MSDNEKYEGMAGPSSRSDVLKAVRATCIDCMGGQVQEVAACSSKICPLRPFRFGKVHPSAARRKQGLGNGNFAALRAAESNEEEA